MHSTMERQQPSRDDAHRDTQHAEPGADRFSLTRRPLARAAIMAALVTLCASLLQACTGS